MKVIRSHSIEFALLTVLLAAIAYFAYLAYGLMPGSVVDQPFSGERAIEHARQIVSFGTRPVGSAANKKVGEWLTQYVSNQGWDIVLQPFTMTNELPAQNIIAIRSPGNPQAPVALLVTHYDTRLVADGDLNPANHQTPSIAANKGASGAALLAELARTLDVESSGHTVCLAFFGAEENGDLPGWEPSFGSRLFLENLDRSARRCASPRIVIEVDLVGARNAVFHPVANDGAIDQALRTTANELGYSTTFDTTPTQLSSHHVNWFLQQGIESTTLADYNYPFIDSLSDTMDKLDSASLERVGRTLEVWLERGADLQ